MPFSPPNQRRIGEDGVVRGGNEMGCER
ncbi:hypothetical protein CCACVL1_25360 [Corchorus capsularis]|uniref:Uncharacterized protein n=1 Tax=Corchorus capsularis TaxID=210143 RepID=A0A1R3GL41_COCAP|nr:hypothetical protein CCACVL1_25360 [Corchorus capsularis]